MISSYTFFFIVSDFSNFYLDSWSTLAWKCGFDLSPESLYFMVIGKALVEYAVA